MFLFCSLFFFFTKKLWWMLCACSLRLQCYVWSTCISYLPCCKRWNRMLLGGGGETMLRTSCIHCKYHFKKKMCNSCGIFIHNCTSVLVKYQDLFLTCFVYFCMNLYYFLSFLSALLSFRPDSICKVIIFLMQLVFADHEQKKAFSCHIKSAKVSKPL